jgi:hypothetical protein
MNIGEFVKHPDFKREVQITQIDSEMVAVTVWPSLNDSGCYRHWVKRASFGNTP